MKSAKACALQMSETLNEIGLEIIENREDDWVLFAHIMGIVEVPAESFWARSWPRI